MEPTFPPRTSHSTPCGFFAGTVLIALALFFTALSAANAASPQVPNIGTVMQDAQTARPTPPPLREDTDIVKKRDQDAQEDQSGPTIAVREFKLENVEYLSEAEIQKVLEPFKGRSLTMKQLDEATKVMGELYQRKGYVAVKTRLFTPWKVLFQKNSQVLGPQSVLWRSAVRSDANSVPSGTSPNTTFVVIANLYSLETLHVAGAPPQRKVIVQNDSMLDGSCL